MNRVSTTVGEFARRGFEHPGNAARTWQDWRARLDSEPPVPLHVFTRAADRDQALECMVGIGERAPAVLARIAVTPEWLDRVLLVLGGSSVLARFLMKNPGELEALATAPGARREGWREYIRSRAMDESGQIDADLRRRANHAALVQVAVRDLASEDPLSIVDDIAAELSHVADAVLECALECARAEVSGSSSVRIAVVAMGKAGAEELNYISDVDVIYIAEPVEGGEHDEAMRVGAKVCAAMARICSAHTSEGTIWPIDAALRPEGNAGPLVRSIASCSIYYGKWAKNWEFQALLKARPAAGDLDLGQAFCDMVSPLVWEAAQRPGFLPDVRAMRNRVISLIPAKEADREIKLGIGGLRDTEFTVQLLQLVHGRGDERVRARGTSMRCVPWLLSAISGARTVPTWPGPTASREFLSIGFSSAECVVPTWCRKTNQGGLILPVSSGKPPMRSRTCGVAAPVQLKNFSNASFSPPCSTPCLPSPRQNYDFPRMQPRSACEYSVSRTPVRPWGTSRH